MTQMMRILSPRMITLKVTMKMTNRMFKISLKMTLKVQLKVTHKMMLMMMMMMMTQKKVLGVSMLKQKPSEGNKDISVNQVY